MRLLLQILTYAGLVLGAASTIWGLLHEPAKTDENNKRHLTKAGKIAILMTLASLFVSGNTAILSELIAKQDKADDAQAETLARVTQTNEILWDIRRGQYPFDPDIWVEPNLRISLDHPALRAFAGEIDAEGRRLYQLARLRAQRRSGSPGADDSREGTLPDSLFEGPNLVGDSDRIVDLLSVESNPTLLPDDEGAERLLSFVELDLRIYKRGSDVTNPGSPRDISMTYAARMFEGNQVGTTTYRGSVSYAATRRHFRLVGPGLPHYGMMSSGQITSLLDLPGATLTVACDSNPQTGCDRISIESLEFLLPSGLVIQIPGKEFRHGTVQSVPVLLHTFDPDSSKFLDKYSRFMQDND